MAAMVNRKCKCCKVVFQARQSDVNRGWGLFCSKRCKAIVQERKNGQHAAYLNGRGISNLHPERLKHYDDDDSDPYYITPAREYDDHPFSSEGLGQWGD